MANNNYQLTVQQGPQEGQTYSLVATMITIGRDPMADIVITDPEVSRQHVRLTRANGGYEIQDLGSTNGTFLDGRRLGGEPHPLSPGQVITMGSNVSLLYSEAGDVLETVIATEGAVIPPEEEQEEAGGAQVNVYDFPEVEEEEYGTVLEAPDVYEDVDASEPADEALEADTSFDFPSFEEAEEATFPDEEAVPSFDDAEELPAFDEEALPDFDEEALPDFDEIGAPAYSQTVLESEPDLDEPLEKEPEGERPVFESKAEEAYTPRREAVTPPPPPTPPGAPPARSNRNRNIIIGVLVLLFLLCCCCLFLILAWNYGDAVLYELQFQ